MGLSRCVEYRVRGSEIAGDRIWTNVTHAYSVNAHAVWSCSGKYQGCAKVQYYPNFGQKVS